MGFRMFSSSSLGASQPKCPAVWSKTTDAPAPVPGMPDPHYYELLKIAKSNRHLLLMLRYPTCTNYEGVKILLFLDTTLDELQFQGGIDPHFSDSQRFRHPFARFEPTDKGWECGMKVMEMMQENSDD